MPSTLWMSRGPRPVPTAAAHLGLQACAHVLDQRLDTLALREQVVEHPLEIEGLGAEVPAEHEVVEIECLAEARRESIALEQVGNAHGAARHLVLVGRADAAASRADGLVAAGAFTRAVQRLVPRHDDGAGRRYADARANLDALELQRLDLLAQGVQGQHHAVADQAFYPGLQDAGRYQVQHGLLAVDDQRVAGVVAALEAHHRGCALREQVDDLALAFVAPLGADDDEVLGHWEVTSG